MSTLMPLTPGTRLGPYEITAPLGAGGMGEVYRARDVRLERTVAVKILPSQFSLDSARRERFEREAKTISNLNLPHICVLYDVGHQDGMDYLVMECLDGETLAKRLEKGALQVDQVLKFGGQIADALDSAHRKGVVHRDLKPANIMLTASGAKLLDFGLAKPAMPPLDIATLSSAATLTTPMTMAGTVVGTFQYMSPEQTEGTELDGRSDIFSFGAVLYEMVTGVRAFQGKSQWSVASAILERDPAPISSIKPLTPPALDHAIQQCLAKDPLERWQTARDLSLEFKWIGGSGSQIGVTALPGSSPVRERIAWATVAILMCVLAVLGTFHWQDEGYAPQIARSAIVPPADTQFVALDVDGGSPAISPDGKQLVSAVADSKGGSALWLRGLDDAGEGRMLPRTEGGGHPFWAPDGRSIGFFTRGKLKRIAADGTSLQSLCEVARGRGGTWSADGTILFTPSTASALYEISANGGTPNQVTKLNRNLGESSHRWPIFLADGRHFLFFVRSYQTELSGIYVGALGSKEYHQLIKTPFGAAFAGERILFVRNETLFAQRFDPKKLSTVGEPIPLPERVAVNPGNAAALLSVSSKGIMTYYPSGHAGGPYQLAWYGRDGKTAAPAIATGYFYGSMLSPDGSHALVPTQSEDGSASDVWSYDLARGTKTRLSSGPGYKNTVAWQADGKAVFFSTALGDVWQVYRIKSDGTGAPEAVLKSESEPEHPESACRDGRYLAYSRGNPPDKTSLWILPLAGDRKPFPLLQSQASTRESAFSPDCNWVAYSSNESGRFEVFLTHFPDATRKYLVSTDGGRNPHWRGDGKELFYYSPERKSLIAVSVEKRGGEELALGTPQALFSAPVAAVLGNLYDVTSDGKRFLFSGIYSSSGDVPLTLVMNWDAELKRR